ncbi:MAG: PCI domain-containing protein [Promethearchaeota archaeon]
MFYFVFSYKKPPSDKNLGVTPVKDSMKDMISTKQKEKLIAILKLYPRISLMDLGEKLGISMNDVENLLINMKLKDEIKGYIDPGSRVFISGMVDDAPSAKENGVPARKEQVFYCPFCGFPNYIQKDSKNSFICVNCGNTIQP